MCFVIVRRLLLFNLHRILDVFGHPQGRRNGNRRQLQMPRSLSSRDSPPRLNCYRPLSAARCPSHTGSDKKVMSSSSAHPTTSNWSSFNCGCGRSEESHSVSFACHISLLFLRAFDQAEQEGKRGKKREKEVSAAEVNSDNTI